MGSTMTVTTKITQKYLMNKTKHELCCFVDMLLDQLDDYQQRETEVCVWSENENWDDNTWESSCAVCWEFIEDGPKENDMNFCPKCGKRLVIIKQEEENE